MSALSPRHDDPDEDVEPEAPVEVDAYLNAGRYRVLELLSDDGHFSTVWLAQETATLRPVALKVQRCPYFDNAQHEVTLLTQIKNTQPPVVPSMAWQPGAPLPSHAVDLLDSFVLLQADGPAQFMVMVFEWLGHSFSDVLEHECQFRRGLPIVVCKRLARDALLGLVQLHDLKLIHTDIRPENIACLPSTMFNGETFEGVPLSADPFRAKIIDLGNALPLSVLTDKIQLREGEMVQSREYRAPESVLRLPFGVMVDVWSLGCVVYELVTGDVLFGLTQDEDDDPNSADREHLHKMQQLLGRFPQGLVNHPSQTLFDSHGLVSRARVPSDSEESDAEAENTSVCPPSDRAQSLYQTLSALLSKEVACSSSLPSNDDDRDGEEVEVASTNSTMSVLSTDEIGSLASFLSACLSLDPESGDKDGRWTTRQLLQHPWLQFDVDQYITAIGSLVVDSDDAPLEELRASLAASSEMRNSVAVEPSTEWSENKSAIVIQAAFRGYTGRREHSSHNNSVDRSFSFEEVSAGTPHHQTQVQSPSSSLSMFSSKGDKMGLFSSFHTPAIAQSSASLSLSRSSPLVSRSAGHSKVSGKNAVPSRQQGVPSSKLSPDEQSTLLRWHDNKIKVIKSDSESQGRGAGGHNDGDISLWISNTFVRMDSSSREHRNQHSSSTSGRQTVASGLLSPASSFRGRDNSPKQQRKGVLLSAGGSSSSFTPRTLSPRHVRSAAVSDISTAEFNAKSYELVPDDLRPLLSHSDWRERVVGLEMLNAHLSTNAAPWSRVHLHVFVEVLLASKPGFKGCMSNAKAAVLLLDMVAGALTACQPGPHKLFTNTVKLVLPDLLGKLTDPKTKASAYNCLSSMIVAARSGDLLSQLYYLTAHPRSALSKNPKLVTEALEWLHMHLSSEGLDGVDFTDIANFAISLYIASSEQGGGQVAGPKPSSTMCRSVVKLLLLLTKISSVRFILAVKPLLASLKLERPEILASLERAVPALSANATFIQGRSAEDVLLSLDHQSSEVTEQLEAMRLQDCLQTDAEVCPSRCHVYTPAEGSSGTTQRIHAGYPSLLVVQSRALDGGILRHSSGRFKVSAHGHSKTGCSVTSAEGLAFVSFVCGDPGPCTVSIRMDGEHVKGSPFRFIAESRPHVPELCTFDGAGASQARAGQRTTFKMTARRHAALNQGTARSTPACDGGMLVMLSFSAAPSLSPFQSPQDNEQSLLPSLSDWAVHDAEDGTYTISYTIEKAFSFPLYLHVHGLDCEGLGGRGGLCIQVLPSHLHLSSSTFHLFPLATNVTQAARLPLTPDNLMSHRAQAAPSLTSEATSILKAGDPFTVVLTPTDQFGNCFAAPHESLCEPCFPWVRVHCIHDDTAAAESSQLDDDGATTTVEGELFRSCLTSDNVSSGNSALRLKFSIPAELTSKAGSWRFVFQSGGGEHDDALSTAMNDDQQSMFDLAFFVAPLHPVAANTLCRTPAGATLCLSRGSTADDTAIVAVKDAHGNLCSQMKNVVLKAWLFGYPGSGAETAKDLQQDPRHPCIDCDGTAVWQLCCVDNTARDGTCSVLLPSVHTPVGDYCLHVCLVQRERDHPGVLPSDFSGGEHICGSPYPVNVVPWGIDSSQCTVDGRPQQYAGRTNTFTISSKDCAGHPVTTGGDTFCAVLFDEERTGFEQHISIVEIGKGEYVGSWITKKVGAYSLSVTLAGQSHILGSPYCGISWEGAEWSPSQSSAAGRGLEMADVGVQALFTIVARDHHGNEGHDFSPSDCFRVSIRGPSKSLVSLDPYQRGTFVGEYTPNLSGPHTLSVTLRGAHIPGSPFNISVGHGQRGRPWASQSHRNSSPARRRILAEFKEKQTQRLRDAQDGSQPDWCAK